MEPIVFSLRTCKATPRVFLDRYSLFRGSNNFLVSILHYRQSCAAIFRCRHSL